MAAIKLNFKTPLVKLEWCVINGKGKKKYDPTNSLDDTDPKNFQYTCTAIMTETQATQVKATLQEFWKNNKPAGATKQKYDLIKPVMVPDLDSNGAEQEDEDGCTLKKHNGMYSMMAKTNTTWPDGKANVIKLLRANGNPLNLGDKQIGNGSEGVIHGNIGINGFGGNEGLLFYLSAVQLKKFVEHTGSDEVEADDLGDEDLGDLDDGIDAADVSNEDGPKI